MLFPDGLVPREMTPVHVTTMLRLSISLLAKCSIWQKYLLHSLNHIRI